MIIFHSHKKPLSKYCPVTLHLSPAIRILNENPVDKVFFFFPPLLLAVNCVILSCWRVKP